MSAKKYWMEITTVEDRTKFELLSNLFNYLNT